MRTARCPRTPPYPAPPATPTTDLRASIEAVRHEANTLLGQPYVGPRTTDATCAIYDRAGQLSTLLFDAIRADQAEAEAQAKRVAELAS